MAESWDDALAKDCLETAIKAWNDEKAHPTPNPAAAASAERLRQVLPRGGVLAASQGVVSGAQGGRNGRAARALRQVLARPAHQQLRRPASAVAALASDRTGLRLWN